MKRFFVVIVIIIFLYPLFAEVSHFSSGDEWGYDGFALNISINDQVLRVLRYNENSSNGMYVGIVWDEFDLRKTVIDKYGFPVVKIFGEDAYFFYGGDRCLLFFISGNKMNYILPEIKLRSLLNEYGSRIVQLSNGVIVKTSSNLKDKKIRYDESGLIANFFGEIDGCKLYNTLAKPWAEGNAGSGINESLVITFIESDELGKLTSRIIKNDKLVVLNGYIDFFKPYLFKQNNRVRSMQVDSLDSNEQFSFIIELQDTPNFQEIFLPRKVSQVKLTILSVYPGSMYDDTCITGVFKDGHNYYGVKGYYKATSDLEKKKDVYIRYRSGIR